jgi:hypothetical protein
MSAGDGCDSAGAHSAGSIDQRIAPERQPIALENKGENDYSDDPPPDSKSRELLKAMYYWVLSRL